MLTISTLAVCYSFIIASATAVPYAYDSGGYAPGYGARAAGSASVGAASYSTSSIGGNRRVGNFASGSISNDQYPGQQQLTTSPFPIAAMGPIGFPAFPSPFPGGASPFFPPFQPIQYAPLPPVLTPPQFNDAITTYLNSIQAQYARYGGGSFAYSSPGATAYAYSSLGPTNLYAQQQQLWDTWRNGVSANPAAFYAPNFAAATGSFGPSGIHQTATLNPENPDSPNVDNRFDAQGTSNSVPAVGSGGVGGGEVSHSGAMGSNPGFVGIQTASFSTSSDINGVQTSRKGAITSVNDNGKVTTYKVES